jgi:hypothetical protein
MGYVGLLILLEEIRSGPVCLSISPLHHSNGI